MALCVLCILCTETWLSSLNCQAVYRRLWYLNSKVCFDGIKFLSHTHTNCTAAVLCTPGFLFQPFTGNLTNWNCRFLELFAKILELFWQNFAKNGPKWPKMAQNGPKWLQKATPCTVWLYPGLMYLILGPFTHFWDTKTAKMASELAYLISYTKAVACQKS